MTPDLANLLKPVIDKLIADHRLPKGVWCTLSFDFRHDDVDGVYTVNLKDAKLLSTGTQPVKGERS